jgi:cytochrome c553
MKKTATLILTGALLATSTAWATPATDELFARFKSEGAANFDAERGKAFWAKKVKKDGEDISCTTCHGDDLTKPGKHRKSGKVIEPMAPSVNHERLTEVKEMDKWFKRNCNDVLSHECTAQEKGDVLKFLLTK